MKMSQLVNTYEKTVALNSSVEGEVLVKTVPMKRVPKLFENTGFDHESVPAMTVKFNPLTMKLSFELQEVSTDPDEGPAVMVMSEFQRYLAWFAVW